MMHVNSDDLGTKKGTNKDLNSHETYEAKVNAYEMIAEISKEFLIDICGEKANRFTDKSNNNQCQTVEAVIDELNSIC